MFQAFKLSISFLIFLLILFSINTILSITTSLPMWLCMIFSFICALLTGWFSWQLVSGKKMSASIAAISGALMLGGLFFIIGFLGPMAFAKETSHGPLIGIFIAAPLGMVMGAIAGYLYVSRQNIKPNN